MANGGFVPYGELVKQNNSCKYLGGVKKNKQGLTVKVKCSCTKAVIEKHHIVHECSDPENRHHQCLPTMTTPFDEEHQTEAALFRVCLYCPKYPNR